jgi:DNA polymerase-3 subunit delta'
VVQLEQTTSTTERYPWHESLWQALAADPARLAHALLLSGQAGLGKHAFAHRLARALLCTQPDADHEGCGHCKSCLLFNAGTHPDLAVVSPAEEGKAITVDQVRALVEFATKRPHTAARKVVILAPADSMNLNAANSLLKILEEPPLGNVFVLVSHEPAKLPATVRSRCQRVDFRAPPRVQAIAWLQSQGLSSADAGILLALAAGAPLRALELEQSDFRRQRSTLLADIEALPADPPGDLVACAARWQAVGPELCLGWFQGVVLDLIKLAMGETTPERLGNEDLASRLHALAEGLNLKQLYNFADALAEAHSLVNTPLDSLLLLEDILIRWSELNKSNNDHRTTL